MKNPNLLSYLTSYSRAIRDNRIFLDDHYTVSNRVLVKITVFQMLPACNTHIIPNTAILVQDSSFDIATLPHTDRWWLLRIGQFYDSIEILVIIGSHHVSQFDDCATPHTRAHPDNRTLDLVRQDNTSIRNNGVVQCCPRYFRRWKHTWPCEYRLAKQVKGRNIIRQLNIRFKERTDRTDIRPITIKLIAEYPQFSNRIGNDFLAKVHPWVFGQQSPQDILGKHIDSHRSQIVPSLSFQIFRDFRSPFGQ